MQSISKWTRIMSIMTNENQVKNVFMSEVNSPVPHTIPYRLIIWRIFFNEVLKLLICWLRLLFHTYLSLLIVFF